MPYLPSVLTLSTASLSPLIVLHYVPHFPPASLVSSQSNVPPSRQTVKRTSLCAQHLRSSWPYLRPTHQAASEAYLRAASPSRHSQTTSHMSGTCSGDQLSWVTSSVLAWVPPLNSFSRKSHRILGAPSQNARIVNIALPMCKSTSLGAIDRPLMPCGKFVRWTNGPHASSGNGKAR